MPEDELRVTILSKDKIEAAWELSNHRLAFVYHYFGKPYGSFRTALRIYDITDLYFNGQNAHQYHGFMMKEGQNSWRLKGLNPYRHYCLELGIHLTETEFFPLLRSIPFHTNIDEHESIEINGANINSEQKNNQLLPKWSNHVSTYSYYETAMSKGD